MTTFLAFMLFTVGAHAADRETPAVHPIIQLLGSRPELASNAGGGDVVLVERLAAKFQRAAQHSARTRQWLDEVRAAFDLNDAQKAESLAARVGEICDFTNASRESAVKPAGE